MNLDEKTIILTPSYSIAQKYKNHAFKNALCKLPRFISYDDIEKNLFIITSEAKSNNNTRKNYYEKLIYLINKNIPIKEAIQSENHNKNCELNNPKFREQSLVFEELKTIKDPSKIFYLKSLCPSLYDLKFESFFESQGIKAVNTLSSSKKEISKISYESNFELAKKLITFRNSRSSSLKAVIEDSKKLTALAIFGVDERKNELSSESNSFNFFISITKYALDQNLSSMLSLLTHPQYSKRISSSTLNIIRNLEIKNHSKIIELDELNFQSKDLERIREDLYLKQPTRNFLTKLIYIHKQLVSAPEQFQDEYSFLLRLSQEISCNSAEDICKNFTIYLNTFSKFSIETQDSFITSDISHLNFHDLETVLIDDEALKTIERNYAHTSLDEIIKQIPAKEIIVLYKKDSDHSSLLFKSEVQEISITQVEQIKPVKKHKKPEISCKNKPSRISMSGIEKLIRNPYTFGLEYILKLRPTSAIFEQSMEKSFGILAHDTIASFSTDPTISFEEKYKIFEPILDQKISRYTDDQVIKTLWKENLKISLKCWNEELVKFPQSKFYFEAQGKLKFEDIELNARADLIRDDYDKISIIDFKTGTLPSNSDVITGMFPQLSLEAFIVSQKGFESKNDLPIEMNYIKLSGKDGAFEIKTITTKNQDLSEELKNLFDITINSHSYFATSNDFDPKVQVFKHHLRKEEWFDQS